MDKKINVLVVEDEFAIALDLENRLNEMSFNVVGIASNYSEALQLIAENDIDIAILDINLNDKKNGIDIAKIINAKFKFPFIFLTAYTDESVFKETLPTNPMGFITKPFKDSDLRNTIVLALEKHKLHSNSSQTANDSNFIFVKDKGKLVTIRVDEILWIQAIDNYSLIKTTKGKYISNSNLKTTIEKINNDNILRIHKSHAIAIDKIDKIEDNMVYIKSDYLGVSRKFKNELMSKFKML